MALHAHVCRNTRFTRVIIIEYWKVLYTRFDLHVYDHHICRFVFNDIFHSNLSICNHNSAANQKHLPRES